MIFCGMLRRGGYQPRQLPVFTAAKKKGCKENKCSNWKGNKCRCGRS